MIAIKERPEHHHKSDSMIKVCVNYIINNLVGIYKIYTLPVDKLQKKARRARPRTSFVRTAIVLVFTCNKKNFVLIYTPKLQLFRNRLL